LLHPGKEPRCENHTKYCDGSFLVSCEGGFAIDDPVQCTGSCVDLADTATCKS
jgi:hypothetical protein